MEMSDEEECHMESIVNTLRNLEEAREDTSKISGIIEFLQILLSSLVTTLKDQVITRRGGGFIDEYITVDSSNQNIIMAGIFDSMLQEKHVSYIIPNQLKHAIKMFDKRLLKRRKDLPDIVVQDFVIKVYEALQFLVIRGFDSESDDDVMKTIKVIEEVNNGFDEMEKIIKNKSWWWNFIHPFIPFSEVSLIPFRRDNIMKSVITGGLGLGALAGMNAYMPTINRENIRSTLITVHKLNEKIGNFDLSIIQKGIKLYDSIEELSVNLEQYNQARTEISNTGTFLCQKNTEVRTFNQLANQAFSNEPNSLKENLRKLFTVFQDLNDTMTDVKESANNQTSKYSDALKVVTNSLTFLSDSLTFLSEGLTDIVDPSCKLLQEKLDYTMKNLLENLNDIARHSHETIIGTYPYITMTHDFITDGYKSPGYSVLYVILTLKLLRLTTGLINGLVSIRPQFIANFRRQKTFRKMGRYRPKKLSRKPGQPVERMMDVPLRTSSPSPETPSSPPQTSPKKSPKKSSRSNKRPNPDTSPRQTRSNKKSRK